MTQSDRADVMGWICFVGGMVASPSVRGFALMMFAAAWWVFSWLVERNKS